MQAVTGTLNSHRHTAMATWYRTRFGKIEELEIVRETTDCVFPVGGQGRREHKRSNWSNWFPTKDEAVQHLLDVASRKMQRARDDLDRAEKEYGDIQRLYR